MKFLIVTHVIHTQSNHQYFAYEPYVREMNLWLKKVDEVIVVAPLTKNSPTTIDDSYQHNRIDFREVTAFSLISLKNTVVTFFMIPGILCQIFKAMQEADHIHLRCPGNMGLLACIVQIFFPSKTKTAKFAGNWDPKSKQPRSYRLQKWILSNTFLTRNMKVLVYGEWPEQSQNSVPFFTASYSESESEVILKSVNPDTKIKFLFVGSLTAGKNPMYAIQLLEQLKDKNLDVELAIYGDGLLRKELADYIWENNLSKWIILYGNQNKQVLKKAYQESHFVILASKSEGWPKAIAEGMFWGCVPIATSVSCVPAMLDNGKRGVLLELNLQKDVEVIHELIAKSLDFENKSKAAMTWSGKYTLEYFETEIQKLLQ